MAGTNGKRKRRCVTLDLGIVNGKPRRKYFYGRSKREAEKKRDAFKLTYRRGTNPDVGKQSVQQFLEMWLKTTVKRNTKERTYTSYEGTIRLHIVPSLGSRRLDTLTPEDVDEMILALEEKERETRNGKKRLSARTIQYACLVLSRALNWAVKRKYLPENVVILAEVPKVVQYEIQPLTEADARCFLETLKGHRLEPLYRVALWLGMRKGELLSLCWSDVNMKTGVISVETSKTEAGVRTLAVPAPLLDILNAHQERQQEERRMQGVQWQEHGLVFPSEVGTRMLPGNLHRHFKATLEKAGLRNSIRFHDLRHTCASFLVAQGAHPRTIMNILGHSKVHTTMEIYAHTLDNTQRSALESLDTMFR